MNQRFTPVILTLCVCLFGTTSASPAIGRKVDTRVSQVTVYSDRAMVTREGKTSLESGVQRITIGGVPPLLLDETVRVSASGTAEAKILEVKVERVFMDTIPATRMKPLLEKSKTIADELQKLTDRSAVVAKQQEFLGKIGIASSESISYELRAERPKVEEWKKTLAFLDDELTRLNEESRTIRAQRQDLEQAFRTVQSEIKVLGGGSERSEKQIAVLIDVSKAGLLKFEASYLVDQAGWTPTYDIRVASGDTTVSLAYAAFVKQNTGEDWTSSRLTLSTSRPTLGGSPPEALPWFIGTAEGAFGWVEGFVRDAGTGDPLVGANVTVSGRQTAAATDVNGYYRIANVQAGSVQLQCNYIGYQTVATNVVARPFVGTRADIALTAQAVAAEEVVVTGQRSISTQYSTNAVRIIGENEPSHVAKEDRFVSYQTTTVSSAMTAASFEIAGESNIPSDNANHRVSIMVASVGASLSYISVPRIQADAFLKATMRNSTDYPLLPGPMSVYLDNSFIVNSKLAAVLAGEPFEAYLGIDNGVKVERKLLNRLTDQTGLFSKKRTTSFDIVIIVQNLKKAAQAISIRESIPVSQDERIKVTLSRPAPEEAVPDANGIITWQMTLGPGARRELRLQYSVEAPFDVNVGGME